MLNACELASDAERAAQWCKVADDFVATYGCPFLYAECRIFYGSVLTAKGRWERCRAGAATPACASPTGACPGLHRRALTRLAALRVRQGRLEDADAAAVRGRREAAAEAESTIATGRAAAGARRRGGGEQAAPAAVAGGRPPRVRMLRRARSTCSSTPIWRAATVAAAARASARLTTVADERRQRPAGCAGHAAAGTGVARLAGMPARPRSTWRRRWRRGRGVDAPFEAARAEVELARALAGTDGDVAIDHARRALAAFEQLGRGARGRSCRGPAALDGGRRPDGTEGRRHAHGA